MGAWHPQSRSPLEPMADPAERRRSVGPTDTDLVEYLVVRVPDLGSLRTVAPSLADLVTSAAIRILDLVCVSKSAEGGELTVMEFEEVEGMSELENVDGDVGGLLSIHDIETASRPLPAGSSAILLVVEDRWAQGLSMAARQAGGRVVGGGRVARPQVEAVFDATYRTTAADQEPGVTE